MKEMIKDFQLFILHVENRENTANLFVAAEEFGALLALEYATRITEGEIVPKAMLLFSPLLFVSRDLFV